MERLTTLLSVRNLPFDSLTGQIGNRVAKDSPLLQCFIGSVLPRRKFVEIDPATRYTLRRNTASIMKI